MRAVVQRVREASVQVEGTIVGQIGVGMLILLGVGPGDGRTEAELLADKCAGLRIFSDEAGKFNLALRDIQGEVLVVSQFTLYGNIRKGRRPSFLDAAPPEIASPLVDHFAATLRTMGYPVATGVFGADMKVALVNDGPVTMILDTETWREPRNT